MTRAEIRLLASIMANSEECRAWIRKVESMNFAHSEALDWAVDNTPADTEPRRALVRFATGHCGGFHDQVPANVIDRIERLFTYYQESGYDPTSEVVRDPDPTGVVKGEQE